MILEEKINILIKGAQDNNIVASVIANLIQIARENASAEIDDYRKLCVETLVEAIDRAKIAHNVCS